MEQMNSANYNSRTTLSGKIKFRYLTNKALENILQTPNDFNIDDDTSRKHAIWTLIRNQFNANRQQG